MSIKFYSKDFLVDEFHRYYQLYGKYPLLRDFDKVDGFPSSNPYVANWNTYSDFLKDVGVVSKDNVDGWYIQDEELLRNHYEYGSKEYILDNLLIERTWNTVKKKASKLGIKRKACRSPFSKEELINKLIEFYKENNRPPKTSDCMMNGLPSRKVFMNKFGSWNTALKEAGLTINTDFNVDKEEIIARAFAFHKINGRSPYSREILKSNTPLYNHWKSYDDFLISINLPLNRKKRNPKIKTNDELLYDYKDLYNSLGRIPLANDIDNCEELASFSTYIKRFKNYENIWQLCNIEESINILKKTTYGSICLDKNGDICKSLAEMVITNLFIDNKIPFIKELNYKEIFPDYSGKTLVMDWYLPNENIAIEYFGLYRKKQNTGIASSYRDKTKKKIEIFQKYNVPLIDLYQEDLNEIYLSRVVNKFEKHSIEMTVLGKNLYKNRIADF